MGRLQSARCRTAGGAVVLLSLVASCSGAEQDAADGLPAGQEVGDRVEAALDEFMAADFAGTYDAVRAVRVVVGDQTVVDATYDDSEGESAEVASVTKSVMSLLIGIAIDQGTIPGVDATLAQLLPDRRDEMAPGVGEVTLAQVLTMTGGLLQDERDASSPFTRAGDWVKAILAEELERPPGEAFAYAGAGSHLLSAILVEATGQTVLAYAREHLFDPLGIDTTPAAEPELVATAENFALYERADFAWPTDPQGLHAGHAALKLSVDDMTAIGQLMLDEGEWDGRQVVPDDWVAVATRAHVDNTNSSKNVISPGYGYQWWVTSAADHPGFAAAGYGGQLIEVVPDLDLVVVTSSHIPRETPARATAPAMVDLVNYVIAPAVLE
jgi:CubicO group peptidase (beta-lactamase class C family)